MSHKMVCACVQPEGGRQGVRGVQGTTDGVQGGGGGRVGQGDGRGGGGWCRRGGGACVTQCEVRYRVGGCWGEGGGSIHA